MSRVRNIKKQTDNRFLNMYELETVKRNGDTSPYFLASRSESIDDLKLYKKDKPADGVMICAVIDGRMVLERQFRYTIDDYIYEFPAGLMEAGESVYDTAVREFLEETGLKLTPVTEHNSSRPYYPSIGLSDESIATVYGYAEGIPSSVNQEDTEDITVVLADKEECRRILLEENVSIMAAFILMNFIHTDDDPFGFLI